MKHAVVAVAVALAVVSCKPSVKVPPPSQEESETTIPLPVSTINIGDIEAQVHLYCDVAEDLGNGETIKVERMNTRKYDLGMITIDLYPPFPTSLVVTCRLEDNLPKREAPVALRGSIQLDDEPLQPFDLILTKNSERKQDIVKADVLAGMTDYPDTMLVIAKSTAVLLPAGTDPSTIDPKTVEGTLETQSVLLSNPVRINFHREGAGS